MAVLFIVGKNDYIDCMMKFFDYIFYRIYNYLDVKFQKYPNVPNPADWYACAIFSFLFFMPITCVVSAQRWFDIPLHGREEWRPIFYLILLPFCYRYLMSERIKKGNYEMFRKKWGNEPAHIRRRNSWIILIACIVNIILFPIGTILLQILHVI